MKFISRMSARISSPEGNRKESFLSKKSGVEMSRQAKVSQPHQTMNSLKLKQFDRNVHKVGI